MTADTTEVCWYCPHTMNEHTMVTIGDNATNGGIIVCPFGCICFSTWSVQGRPAPAIEATDPLVDHIRQEVLRANQRIRKQP